MKKYYCCDYPITFDGTLPKIGDPDKKVIGYQLIFSMEDEKEMKKRGQRFVKCEVASDTQSSESRSVEAFEKKYGVKAIWCEIDLAPAINNKWHAYIIDPKSEYFKPIK